MTPQSAFMVSAPIRPGAVDELRKVLAGLNHRPGVADPHNPLVPFARLEHLHFARFIILDDPTVDDITAYGVPRTSAPPILAFLADVDGLPDAFLAHLVRLAGPGLRRIFGYCEGFQPDGDLSRWLSDHARAPAASYVNWVGRTVRQAREEAALADALRRYVGAHAAALAGREPRAVREALVRFVADERAAERLPLMPEAPTPLGWRLRNALHAVGVPLALAALLPPILAYLPVFFVQLRRRERRDPEIVPRPTLPHVRALAELEDHHATNQFSAIGTVKPGAFRRFTLIAFLFLLDYAARHVYRRGYLARVRTIHFARWVFLDGKTRLLFASNYDGSLESYMDDFINKVGWGLNLVFSNGVGYPRTAWLIKGGAQDEQKFKRFIRRHQLPAEVWYDAYAGRSAVDLDCNTRIRRGIERPPRTDAQVRAWLALL